MMGRGLWLRRSRGLSCGARRLTNHQAPNERREGHHRYPSRLGLLLPLRYHSSSVPKGSSAGMSLGFGVADGGGEGLAVVGGVEEALHQVEHGHGLLAVGAHLAGRS